MRPFYHALPLARQARALFASTSRAFQIKRKLRLLSSSRKKDARVFYISLFSYYIYVNYSSGAQSVPKRNLFWNFKCSLFVIILIVSFLYERSL